MMKCKESRCGPLRRSEWQGYWKAHPDDDIMTFEERDAARKSLREWLRQRWVVDWIVYKGRQISVWDTYSHPERTLNVGLRDPSVLSESFLNYVQKWLKSGWSLWRVEVFSDENSIMIYPDAIKINEEAE